MTTPTGDQTGPSIATDPPNPDAEPTAPTTHLAPASVWARRALLVTPVPVLVLGAWTHRLVVDDGFINFRVVNQVLEGHGPVFSTGERVEAFTSPLWIALLTLGGRLFGWATSLGMIAVVAGVALTLVAVVSLAFGPRALGRAAGQDANDRAWWVPVGALVFAATPYSWTYASTGLETGLAFAWISGCYWALAARYQRSVPGGGPGLRPSVHRPRWLLVVIGLGWLIRPELVLVTVGFFAVVVVTSTVTRRRLIEALAMTLAAPLAYQIFRMGYYASMLPNTALAKEGGGANWERGFDYVTRSISYWHLGWVVLVAVALVAVVTVTLVRLDRRAGSLPLTTLTLAVVLAVYVVRVGGDYFAGRFLMIPWLLVLLPIGSVAWSPPATDRIDAPRWPTVAAVGSLTVAALAWSILAVTHGGILAPTVESNFEIYSVVGTQDLNPIDPVDYPYQQLLGQKILDHAARGDDILVNGADDHPIDPGLADVELPPSSGVVAYMFALGNTPASSSLPVHYVDRHGLADAFAARYDTLNGIPIPGHEKFMPYSWARARFSRPIPGEPAEVPVVREGFACPGAQRIFEAVSADLTPGRFLQNLVEAPSLTRLRIPTTATGFRDWSCTSR